MVEQGLAEQKVSGGRRLLKDLDRDGFDVTVALWVKPGEDGKWRLYVASKDADSAGLAAAYRQVYAALQHQPTAPLSPSEVKVIGANDPISRDAVQARDRHAGAGPVVFEGWRLGDTPVDGAYIYPPPPYHLTPADAVARAVSLMTGRRPGQRVRPSSVTLRDGSTREAIPVGVQLDSSGTMVLRFVDVTNGQELTTPAAEVVGID